MTLPTVKGTEGVTLYSETMLLRQALLATSAQMDDIWEWSAMSSSKGIIIATGTTNGIAIKTSAGFGAAGSVIVNVEFVETTFAG